MACYATYQSELAAWARREVRQGAGAVCLDFLAAGLRERDHGRHDRLVDDALAEFGFAREVREGCRAEGLRLCVGETSQLRN